MSLSGQQHKKLQEALIQAFPDKSSLEQMLYFGLDKNLDAIALGDSLQDIVFKLIKKAEAENWVEKLIDAAYKSNPGNQLLKAIAQRKFVRQPDQQILQFNTASVPDLEYLKKLQYLADHIAKDEKLLKDFEDALRYEKDPRVIAEYRQEIERQRESITRYESEMRELQQKFIREPSTRMRMHELDDNTKTPDAFSISVTNHREEENQDTKINYPTDSKDKTQHSSNPTDSEVETYIKRGIDYTQLQEHLSSGKWKEADQETTRVMLEVANRQEEGWLRSRDIEQLSCSELRRIDQLWVKYSNGRFGFTVQRQIWLNLGGQPGKFNFTVFRKFGDRVGWRVNNDWLEQYDQFTFASDAAKGHLPSLRLLGSEKEANWWGLWQKSFRGLLFRMEDCSLS